MQSTIDHALAQLLTFGIDVEPERCDFGALRDDAANIYAGVKPLHLSHLSQCPPRFAADLLLMVASILDPACAQCGEFRSEHPAGDGLSECPGDFGTA